MRCWLEKSFKKEFVDILCYLSRWVTHNGISGDFSPTVRCKLWDSDGKTSYYSLVFRNILRWTAYGLQTPRNICIRYTLLIQIQPPFSFIQDVLRCARAYMKLKGGWICISKVYLIHMFLGVFRPLETSFIASDYS